MLGAGATAYTETRWQQPQLFIKVYKLAVLQTCYDGLTLSIALHGEADGSIPATFQIIYLVSVPPGRIYSIVRSTTPNRSAGSLILHKENHWSEVLGRPTYKKYLAHRLTSMASSTSSRETVITSSSPASSPSASLPSPSTDFFEPFPGWNFRLGITEYRASSQSRVSTHLTRISKT